jgi:hypothetical protein
VGAPEGFLGVDLATRNAVKVFDCGGGYVKPFQFLLGNRVGD